MKVSLNLAQYYSNVELRAIPRDEMLQRIGSQLGAVEEVVDWAPRYEGIVVARVVSCEKHPNADKLHVCRLDDDGTLPNVERDADGFVQVVCGAPNVREDMIAVWIPPGTVVPSTLTKDPFTLEVRDIRGVKSNGMLASPAELGLSDYHDGILEVEDDVQPGTNFSQLYGSDDLVIDIENKMFTHRPDCFGNLGVAREMAGICGLKFDSPQWYKHPVEADQFAVTDGLQLDIKNEAPEQVPRFMAVAMSDVSVGSSPAWLQASLTRVGIKPINNVVDITNYIMHLTGQPLHAFDYDKIAERSNTPGIFPRMAKKGEKLMLLGQKEIELTGEEIVISTDKNAVALAGVLGGADTEVDSNTKSIIIECATFEMYSIRRSSMRHGLFTDAATRYTKGQSPLQNDRVLQYAMKNMAELAGASQASPVFDLHNFDLEADNLNHVDTTVGFINDRLGSELSPVDIKRLLENVEFLVDVEGDKLSITVPFWRMDISIAEDVVEEVGRLYGFDNLPVNLPPRAAKPVAYNADREFANDLRQSLTAAGANELLTYSFVHGDLMRNIGIDPEEHAYHLRNAISPDLQYYRTSLLPSLLAKVHPNIKLQAGRDDNVFVLFEIGKAHVKGFVDEEGLPTQHHRLALVFAAEGKATKMLTGAPYYQAKKYLELLTRGQAEIGGLEIFESDPARPVYADGRSGSVLIGGEVVGLIGEFSPKTRSSLKLPAVAAGFELDVDRLRQNLKPPTYKPLSGFPSIYQDITLESGKDTTWSHVKQLISAELAVTAAESGLTSEVTPLDIFRAEASNRTHFSFRVEFTHPDRTLTTQETSGLLDDVASVLANKHGVKRV